MDKKTLGRAENYPGLGTMTHPYYGLLYSCRSCNSWVPGHHIVDGAMCRKMQVWRSQNSTNDLIKEADTLRSLLEELFKHPASNEDENKPDK